MFMNAAAERLTGYRFAEIQGRNLHSVLLHHYPDGRPYPLQECPIVQAIPKDRSVAAEEEIICKGGKFLPVTYTASPMRDAACRIIGTIIEASDITERRQAEDTRVLLMREVDHRARNVLAVVQSIVQLARANTMPELRQIILGRVSALGRAQGLLAYERWEGASPKKVVEGEIGAVAGPDTFEIVGAERRLKPEDVQPFGMIVHELATNAAKYGALSVPGGTIRVTLEGEGGMLWEERGGPPPSPTHEPGFGMKMMRQRARQMGGELTFDWSDTGLAVRLRRVAAEQGAPAEAPDSSLAAPHRSNARFAR
jgi:PAS domain S-box-containing protein